MAMATDTPIVIAAIITCTDNTEESATADMVDPTMSTLATATMEPDTGATEAMALVMEITELDTADMVQA